MRKEIEKLKNDLFKEKETIHKIEKLIHKKIDREFPINIWELSEKELEIYIGEYILLLNKKINIKPDEKSITSHRKIIGGAIVFIKKMLVKFIHPYTNLLLDKQIEFNQHIFNLCQAVIIQQKSCKEKVEKIGDRISDCEEELVIVRNILEEIHKDLNKLKPELNKNSKTIFKTNQKK